MLPPGRQVAVQWCWSRGAERSPAGVARKSTPAYSHSAAAGPASVPRSAPSCWHPRTHRRRVSRNRSRTPADRICGRSIVSSMRCASHDWHIDRVAPAARIPALSRAHPPAVPRATVPSVWTSRPPFPLGDGLAASRTEISPLVYGTPAADCDISLSCGGEPGLNAPFIACVAGLARRTHADQRLAESEVPLVASTGSGRVSRAAVPNGKRDERRRFEIGKRSGQMTLLPSMRPMKFSVRLSCITM
jgi:hypothetical protein